jgi:multiple sugar transport system substrate-binding protein
VDAGVSARGASSAWAQAALAAALLIGSGCGAGGRVLTVSGSLVGREGDVLRLQLARFERLNPGVHVALHPTPDAADQRHQLYVQWLNAHAGEPDVLQLDVIWTAEFAAAGWIASLDPFDPPLQAFFPEAATAGRWRRATYALPWFVDVGMLYRRTDLVPAPPATLDDLVRDARLARASGSAPFGFVWQGARYEGLVTVFLEYLGAFGGAILDSDGGVVVDSDAAVSALTFMRDMLGENGIVPTAALTWQEEQVRLAFQDGQSAFMRNWPYAYALVSDARQSRVAGRVAVSPMPAGPGGRPTAALGGSMLAVNAFSDQPDAAYRLIEYLLQPDQMIERARLAGQFPSRPAIYDSEALAHALVVPPAEARSIIEHAVARPVTPLYSQLSGILQISLHRALTRQQEPRAALEEAATAMRRVLARAHLGPEGS